MKKVLCKTILALAAVFVCAPALHAQDASQDGSASDHGYVKPGSQPGDTNPNGATPGAGMDPVSGETAPKADFQIVQAPDDADGEDLQKALADFKAGHLDAAASRLVQIVKKSPANPAAHSLLGYIYLKQNKNADAVRELETVVKLAPKDAGAHKNLGRAYLQTGQFDPAAAQFRSVLAATPKDADALFGLALALGQGGHSDQAAAAFQNLIAIAPSALAYQDLGVTLSKSGKPRDAADAFRRAADLNPKDGVSWLNAGLLYAKTGQNDAAIDALTHALAAGGPNKFDALVTRGQVYSNLKQNDKAMADFSAASALRPAEPAPLYNLAVLQQNAGQKADAEANYRRALALKPSDPQIVTGAQTSLGLLLAADSNAAEALPLLEQVVQTDPNAPAPHAALANLYAKGGDTAKAIAERRTVLTLSPGDNDNRVALADLLLAQKDSAGAIVLYKDAALREPNNASLQNALGGAYVGAGNIAGAATAFHAALVADPKNALAQNNLGVVYERQGKTAQAVAAYKKAVALDPSLSDARKNLARFHAK